MKTLLNLLVLVAIVFACIISTSFYANGELLLAYTLILGSFASFVFWIKAVSFTKKLVAAKA
jgi:hypothetical protein